MEGEPKSIHERLHERRREMAALGKIVQRPMYEAARELVNEEEQARREVLALRAAGEDMSLDPELFPTDVFNPDGSRKQYVDGRPKNTPLEDRMWGEWSDSRF